MSDWLGISGRVAVVTGGGGGIGRAICQTLAEAGARVAVLDLDAEGAAETVRLVKENGGEAMAVSADITSEASVTTARDAIEAAFGPAQILVNNAALVRNGALKDLSLADWNAVITVNLTGFFVCSQVFGRRMMEQGGGSIVHVSSVAGVVPQPTSGAYSVSKAGVMMLSKNIAMEWGPSGIRSNVVSPAMVMTPMSAVIYRDPAVKERREKSVPMRRIGQPQDIADAICFLASDRATYISGQEITCDGGWGTTLLATVPRPGFDQPAN
ncbi:SDR family NAD(P)-dependent oxidoreductase [Ruixingdingia sedimenti]|uniref:SDR family NAD(P)-dependent oxidoreductase n=1 Tax=Ruixingdingia sedimenti TaxID=3073604 RepID=A0ABU1F2X6_9RHOB|nr:SDR family NAD(P)-dependent oxidoreductase [Xinfangfangia sp. LG-4]MDR5651207.1 SDR family NAD(P)-dependent oxidoreductase [Xinfangfangia sp. LG-4]